MENKPKNREWVKNAAIIFLAVLLVLTFFSNTIMNRSLPEVATQYIQRGTITAKVRGTGTVESNGVYEVIAGETREIRAVMVRSGQVVEAGDVLFVLGEGDSAELEAAQDQLRELQRSYQTAALSIPSYDYTLEEREIAKLQEAFDAAKADEEAALKTLEAVDGVSEDEVTAARAKLTLAQDKLASAQEKYDKDIEDATKNVEACQQVLDDLIAQKEAQGGEPASEPEAEPAEGEGEEGEEGGGEGKAPSIDELIAQAQTTLDNAKKALNDLIENPDPAIAEAQAQVEESEIELSKLLNPVAKQKYDEAVEMRKSLEEELFLSRYNLEQQKKNDERAQAQASISLGSIADQITKVQNEIKKLSGGEENEILAKVSGTVESVNYMAGQTAPMNEVLCTIEVPDMGYTLSFSVTNDQARRLRVGDTASVTNYYWGSTINATLTNIKTDPKDPQGSKVLTFDVTGDVNAGSNLTLSVGSKSAEYDLVVPNSAIRTDSNGSFVLIVTEKSSPLGNRYIATRVDVDVVIADDVNSAVTGDLESWSYVITTSSKPISNGDMVKLADNI